MSEKTEVIDKKDIVIRFSGDAYVYHPSFWAAVLVRILEA